ncbi:MAG: Ni/Fe-hydrogenase cytochrome b subunit [Desulfobacterales bacterium]|uniref:Ni/Fe-hydrogenase cytochrome b subunit n=1 Tax=Candidatus Desulfatibia vada TaxID=2841696 RepID=A0A8J6TTA6_9BACT|nr:Ni/Fe-hydrogenase cytochrome b subunit [Candidatus Desulfatibia vada]
MKEERPLGGRLFTPTFLFCLLFFIIALFLLAKRFMYGLGAVTNMSDGYPWGIWIAFDVVVGTAFGCGGYAMALLIYVFNKGEYHPLIRPALMTSLFGYSLAGLAVFIDVGRYWQIYTIFLPWYLNPNSVLLEVALCVGAYVVVLWIEFTPAFLQKMGADSAKKSLEKVMFIFIALGILLPTMHQSSLGTVMVVAGSKLSPLWWTPWLPLLFLISCIFMGFAIVIFEASATSTRYKIADERHILSKLSGIFPWMLGIYLIIRFADVAIRGHLGLAFKGDLMGNMFLLENLLLLVPMCILFMPANRNNSRILFFSAISIILAGTLYRFNCYLIGFNPGGGWTYFPAAGEILITVGIVSIEIMAFLWFIKRLPIYHRA